MEMERRKSDFGRGSSTVQREESVIVYSGEDYIDLVKSAKARDRWKFARKSCSSINPGRRTREQWARAAEEARKLRSTGTYARHQEALRLLEEDEKRQRDIAMQNKTIRDEAKFARLMSDCAEAMRASRELDAFLRRHDDLQHSKRERKHKLWNDKVFCSIKEKISKNLTEESFLERKETRRQMHEEYLRACDKPHGVFLNVPGPDPKEINMRYSTKEIQDPLKADLEKSVAEKKLAGTKTPTQTDRGRPRELIDPTDYIKATPTRRAVVHGPPSHARILPNDYTELSCDDEIVRCEMFSCRKRLFYIPNELQRISDGAHPPRVCEACTRTHTCAVVSRQGGRDGD